MSSSELPDDERTHTHARIISETHSTMDVIPDLPEGLKDIKLIKKNNEVIVAIPRGGDKVISVNVTV